jgi:hypothetical protein
MKKDFKFFIGEIDIDFSIPASMRRSELDQYLHRPRLIVSGRIRVNDRRNNNRGEDLPNTQRIRR